MTIHTFRSTAADLALQLQAASRSALLLTDEVRRADRMIEILIKYMPPAQLIHAQLEIDEVDAASIAPPLSTIRADQQASQPVRRDEPRRHTQVPTEQVLAIIDNAAESYRTLGQVGDGKVDCDAVHTDLLRTIAPAIATALRQPYAPAAHLHQRLAAFHEVISRAWAALEEAGYPGDGRTELNEMIKRAIGAHQDAAAGVASKEKKE